MRVYLSSTFEDLQGYRAAVFAALEKAGLDVARMEAYTAADARPLDLCLHDVGQSDIYVGLFAWRYGYEPPAEHGNPQARSITELEYRQAERANLRKLLFFAHPDTKAGWPDHFKDDVTGQGDRGKKLKAFLTELGVEKSTSFFHTPDELATLVLAAIMRSGVSGRAYNIPSLVPGFVPRPNLTRAIVDSLLGPRDAHGVSTLVQGAGGFGKTTLAIHACHQPEVIRAFPDGLLWVTLGERPNLATELSNLHRLATGNEPVVAGIVEIGKAVVRTLMGRRCLVVVDDAWRSDDLAPFLSFDGPLLLVTTRIRSLAQEARQSEWSEVPVDEMETGEAATLLGRGLALEDQTRKALHLLADRLGCWPLLLDLVNARLLEEQKARHGHVAACIDRVTTVFERKGVLGFDRRDSNARTTAVKRSVEVGLERADEMVPGLSERAAQISIFPEHVPIPERVLADLWAMDEFDVEEEALRPLDNLSIVRWDREAGEVGLQDVIRLALAARLAEPTTVHRRLLDAWPDPYHLPHRYAWRWFGWHCLRADELRRLQRLLLDVDWLRAKLAATDINALLEEFDHVQPDRQSDVLQGALRLSAHVLAKRQSQMAGQLLARIPEHESGLRGRVLESIRATREAWLRPLRPSLASAGGPLLRTLDGHAGPVTAVALTRDGTRAVSAGGDRTLKIWDLERGEPVRTLTGHEDWVSAVALTPDGSRAVSASGDRTLKIWDLERGEPLHTLAGQAAWVSAVALTPDGTRAVSASGDCTLKIWDLERAEPLRTLEGHAGPVTAVAHAGRHTRGVGGRGSDTEDVGPRARRDAAHSRRTFEWGQRRGAHARRHPRRVGEC